MIPAWKVLLAKNRIISMEIFCDQLVVVSKELNVVFNVILGD